MIGKIFQAALLSLLAGEGICDTKEIFILKVGDFEKVYPVRQPKSGAPVKIAYVTDFADNIDLLRAVSLELADRLKADGMSGKIDAVVIPGDKANALGALVVERLSQANPYVKMVVFRPSDKAGDAKSVSYQSVTHAGPKKIYARVDHEPLISGKNILILDDVISTGATVKATADLVQQMGGTVIGYACGATEGEADLANESEQEKFNGAPLFKVTHFPLVKL